jgi:hypothetical protein
MKALCLLMALSFLLVAMPMSHGISFYDSLMTVLTLYSTIILIAAVLVGWPVAYALLSRWVRR